MSKTRTTHIRCADIIGYRAAQHSEVAEQLAQVIISHLPTSSRVVLNLSGVPSFSPLFIRTFWSHLARSMSPAEIKGRLHIHSSSLTLREAFEHSFHSVARRFICPHFHTPATAST